MRRVFGLLLLLAISFNHGAVPLVSTQTTAEQFPDETAEAQRVVGEFMIRMQSTRDLSTLRDLYVPDFVRRGRNSSELSLPVVSSSATVSWAVLRALSESDFERYYFAEVNLKYLWVLYFATAHSATEIESVEKGQTDGRHLLPPEVATLLDNSLIKEEVATLQQFHDLLALLEKAAAMMRTRFQQNRPEESQAYRENIGAWTPVELEQKQPKPYLSITSQEQSGFPPGTHFFHVITKPELFELTLVKTEAGVKVIWARVYPFN